MPISTFPLPCMRNHLPIQREETIKALWTLRNRRPLPFAHTRSWLVIALTSPFPKAQDHFSECSIFQFYSLQWLFQEAICSRMLPLESLGHTWECFMNNLPFDTSSLRETFQRSHPKWISSSTCSFRFLVTAKWRRFPSQPIPATYITNIAT